MTETFEYWTVGSEPYERLLATKKALEDAGLPGPVLELVFLRVSQINGCSFCIAMHSAAAKRAGASQDRIEAVADWRENAVFDTLERSVLAWAEAMTHLSDRSDLADLRGRLLAILTPRQVLDLTVAVGLMNALNRLAISLGR